VRILGSMSPVSRSRATLRLVRDALVNARRHKISRLAAALAFYALFSLAPLIVIIVSVSGLTFGTEAVEGEIVARTSGLLGSRGAETIQAIVASAGRPTPSAAAAAVGFAVLLFGASRVFVQLQDAMNTIWEAESRGIRATIRNRLTGFAMVLAAGAVFLLGLVAQGAVAALRGLAGESVPGLAGFLSALDWTLSFALTALLLGAVFRYLPRADVDWADVWPGAVPTTFLFLAGRLAIGVYLQWGAMESIYGAAFSVLVILLWVYYTAQIVFFGAEFTRIYTRRFGSLAESGSPGMGRP
jgi:membrane protein